MLKRLLFLALGLFGAGSVGAAPEELKSSDIGIYGSAWMPWVRENSQSIDFVVYQAGPNRPVPVIIEDIGFAAENGIKVVLVPKLPELEASASAVTREQAVMTSVERVLQPLAGLPLVAVSIGEENIHWDGWSALLINTYDRLHARYPDRRFYQWYSPTKALNLPGVQWPALKTDGWVIDQYFLEGDTYSQYVTALSANGNPVVSVIWASPFWRPGSKQPERDSTWWDGEGWRRFYEQFRVNRGLGVPTAFYMFEIHASGERLALFKGQAGCTQRFMQVFATKTLDTIRSLDELPGLPEKKPDWIPGACGD